MIKKLILSFIFLIFSLSFVSGALTDNNKLYYSFDDTNLNGSNPLDLTPNGNDGTNNGATTGATGLINEAFDFDGTNDYVQIRNDNTGIINNAIGDLTISLWVNYDILTTRQFSYSQRNNDGEIAIGFRVDNANNVIGMRSYNGATYDILNSAVGTSGWHHVVVTYTNSNKTFEIFVDGISEGTNTVSAFVNGASGFHLTIGSFQNSASLVTDGKIDETSIWNRSLSQSEITQLYNSGAGLQYPYGTTELITLDNISANDIELQEYTNFDEQELNITTQISFDNSTDPNFNVSYRVNSGDWVLMEVENNSLTLENLTLENLTIVGQSSPFNATATYDIDNRTPFTLEFLVENNETNTTSDLFNINPFHYATFETSNGTPIYNFSINGVDYVDTNIINFSTYDSGINVGDNNLSFEKDGIVQTDLNFNIERYSITNETYNLTQAQINLFFFDVTDNSLVDDQNFTVEIIGDSFSKEYEVNQTSNYTIIETGLVAGDYTLSVKSQNYSVAFRNFVYTNQENLTLAIYLTPEEVPGETIIDLIVEVIDDYKNIQPQINTQQFIWNSDLGQYVLQNEKRTNEFGRTTYPVFLNTRLYKFCAEYQGELFCEEGITIDAATSVQPIRISILTLTEINRTNIYSKDFSNSLQNFTTPSQITVDFTWENNEQDVDYYCLKIQRREINTFETISDQCSQTHSGSLTYIINNYSENQTFLATSYIKVGDDIRNLEQLFLNINYALQRELEQYGLHIVGALLLIFGAIGVGYNNKLHNVGLSHLLLPLASLIIFLAFPSIHNIETFIFVTIINIATYVFVGKTFEKSEKANFEKLTMIIFAYMVFIFSLITVLTEMENKSILDDRGEEILEYLNPQDSTLKTFFENTGFDLNVNQDNSKEGDFSIFNIVFTKALSFIDIFFAILENLFTIPQTLGYLLGLTSELFQTILLVANFIVDLKIVLIYFEKLFK